MRVFFVLIFVCKYGIRNVKKPCHILLQFELFCCCRRSRRFRFWSPCWLGGSELCDEQITLTRSG
jgi:hypothetical protein